MRTWLGRLLVRAGLRLLRRPGLRVEAAPVAVCAEREVRVKVELDERKFAEAMRKEGRELDRRLKRALRGDP